MAERYRYAGLTITSAVPLGLLAPTTLDAPEILQLDAADRDERPPAHWHDADHVPLAEREAGQSELRRIDGAYLLQYAGCFDLEYWPGRSLGRVYRDPVIDDVSFEHVLLDQALPRILGYAGHLMVHASAVEREGRAVCFIAASGAGKSTLAARLVADGWKVLSDDVVRLVVEGDVVQVHPAYPSLRLWPDSHDALGEIRVIEDAPMALDSLKRVYRLDPEWVTGTACQAAALILLADPAEATVEAVALRALPPATALIRMMGQTFTLHAGASHALASRLTAMARVCGINPPRELVYPRQRESAGSIQALLRTLLGQV